MGNADGTPSDALLKTYQRLIDGGVGAIITGYAGVHPEGRMFANMCMLHSDRHRDAYRSLLMRLQPRGVPLILQLVHGGSRSRSAVTGHPVIGPSYRKKTEFGDVSHAAGAAEIRLIIQSFVRAIVRARDVGFAGVQLHAAHGFLLSEFLSPVANRRSDAWGGSLDSRFRIIREILEQSRERVGDYPILAKISAHDEFRNDKGFDEAIAISQRLQQYSCDGIEVSCGAGDFFYTVRTPRLPINAILAFAPGYHDMSGLGKRLYRIVARMTGKSYRPLFNYNIEAACVIKRSADIPVIAVGGIRSLADITDAVVERNLDFVALSRPFVIEPDIVEKFRTSAQERSRCIECGFCLVGVTSRPLRCYFGRIPPDVVPM